MKENKHLNRGLSIHTAAALLAAFIVTQVFRIYDKNENHYHGITDRIAPVWAVYGPFLVLCIVAILLIGIKLFRTIKLNKSNLKGNWVIISTIAIEGSIIILAFLASISCTMWMSISDLTRSEELVIQFVNGTLKLVPTIVTSSIGLALGIVDCSLSIFKVDR